jgi:hypothetical protein
VLALAANRSYFLARNLLPPLIPMLSTALENYCTIAASNNSYSGAAGNSIPTSSDKISDEKLETIGEVLQGLLWSVTTIMAHACSERQQSRFSKLPRYLTSSIIKMMKWRMKCLVWGKQILDAMVNLGANINIVSSIF